MKKRLLIMLSLLSLIVAACGGDATSDTTAAGAGTGEGGEPATGPANVIRFTFAPDPVWDYINDTGIKEGDRGRDRGPGHLPDHLGRVRDLRRGLRRHRVGGRLRGADAGQAETGQQSVIFGKYNIDRSIITVPASDTTSQTLEDLVGKQIAVWDSVSSTLIWGIIAQQLHDLDLRTGGGDFELVQVDITNTGPVAAQGDVDGAIVLPDFAVNELMTGQLRVLYDGRTAAELYAADDRGQPRFHEGPMINVFLARQDWYEEHQEEVKVFLRMWEEGIQAWQANKTEIIASYPQHFAVETDEQIQFMQDWLVEHDWFVSSVYLDQEWIDATLPMFDVMRDNGFMATDEPDPVFDMPQDS
jgi:hypothetical protein